MSNTNGFVNLPEGIYLNVRQEPNFYSNVLTSLAPKTELTILEQNGEWYQIEYQNESAYVFAQAVSTNSKIKIGGMTLNLGLLKGCGKECKMEQPIFNWNALVISKENILIKDENGDILSGSYTSNGDHITIMKNNAEKGLIFIQYPDQSENCYEQGWIDSKYISSEYLKFRFDEAWINNEENQKIYLFNDAISQAILEKGAKYTLLYAVSNYNIQYSCILFEDNDSLEVGFVPFSTGNLEFIVDNYPYNIANECAIETFEPTVPFNATVTSDIKLIDVNGIEPNYQIVGNKTICPTIAANSRIAVLEIFNSTEKSSMLIEYYDEGANKYKKGYLPLSALDKQVFLDKNNVIWNEGIESIKVINLTNSEVIATISTTTKVKYLYSTKEYACIFFSVNDEWYSGFVSINKGKFFSEKTSNIPKPVNLDGVVQTLINEQVVTVQYIDTEKIDESVDFSSSIINWGSKPMQDLGNGLWEFSFKKPNPGDSIQYQFLIDGSWTRGDYQKNNIPTGIVGKGKNNLYETPQGKLNLEGVVNCVNNADGNLLITYFDMYNSAQRVELATSDLSWGTVNMVNNGVGLWETTIKAPKQGESVQYQFMIDGNWTRGNYIKNGIPTAKQGHAENNVYTTPLAKQNLKGVVDCINKGDGNLLITYLDLGDGNKSVEISTSDLEWGTKAMKNNGYGLWSIEVKSPNPGEILQYQFVVDGNWTRGDYTKNNIPTAKQGHAENNSYTTPSSIQNLDGIVNCINNNDGKLLITYLDLGNGNKSVKLSTSALKWGTIDMKNNGYGLWSILIEEPKQGQSIQYQFAVDGNWTRGNYQNNDILTGTFGSGKNNIYYNLNTEI